MIEYFNSMCNENKHEKFIPHPDQLKVFSYRIHPLGAIQNTSLQQEDTSNYKKRIYHATTNIPRTIPYQLSDHGFKKYFSGTMN
jgi:hypothetical protein